ncbi:Uncharacterized protein QTN25_000240 [Entamoeba marina]
MSKNQLKEMTQIKRESKSFEAIQQAFLISLLNVNGFSFSIKKPERFAVKTLQYFTISEVYNNQFPLEFGLKIEEYCSKQYESEQHENMTKNEIKSCKRRKDINRAALSMNTLVQYCESLGFKFKRKQIKGAKTTLQMVKIQSISYGDVLVADTNSINEIGATANNIIATSFSNVTNELYLNPYHNHFLNLLGCQQPLFNDENVLSTTKSEETSYDYEIGYENTFVSAFPTYVF